MAPSELSGDAAQLAACSLFVQGTNVHVWFTSSDTLRKRVLPNRPYDWSRRSGQLLSLKNDFIKPR